MSTNDPSGQEPEGGGKPSFDKQPPQEGTPSGAPSDPYGAPPPPPPPAGSPYDAPGEYTGTYGAPPPGFGAGPGRGAAPPPTPGTAPGAGPVPGMPPLGTWPNRIVAALVDFVLVEAVAVALVVPFASFGKQDGWVGATWLGYLLWLVYGGLMLSRDGQTLGKKLMKVRVAMLVDGSVPSPAAAWTRAAVFVVPALICCGGLWWPIDGLFGVFDKPYRQCIHDKAAKTVVVSTAI
ncbi:RDD family protein [Kitasatospora sp. DSM 101779]|uniref:RDD family protein n=1 Tax=Kitasatospora sp. DSM 101779 TaxID=2853165 RepID=UPI0021DA0FF6|nr:RDD family protein [Kitasatospora sp. DSM 101779]MCU7824574.1 RDD family protein [Kitasatospora sp. DSM 101779]